MRKLVPVRECGDQVWWPELGPDTTNAEARRSGLVENLGLVIHPLGRPI